MRWMRRSFTNIESASNWCFSAGAACAGFFLFVMTMLITVDVIGRKLGHATGVSHEISGYCLVVIVFMGLAYTLREGGHIQIELVTSRLSQRGRRWLQVVTSFIGVAFSIWLIWVTTKLTIELFVQKSTSMTHLHAPLWMIQVLIPLGLVLFIVAIMLETIKLIKPSKE